MRKGKSEVHSISGQDIVIIVILELNRGLDARYWRDLESYRCIIC